MARKDRAQDKGGGLAFITDRNLQYTLMPSVEDEHIENKQSKW